MTRRPDWRARLLAYLSSVAAEPYVPGQHDCILFAAAGREALTGTDLMADWRGKYSTVPEGYRIARTHGWADPFAYVVSGLPEIAPAFAQVGDLAMLDGIDGLPALGIVQGELIYTVGKERQELAILTAAQRAWRI